MGWYNQAHRHSGIQFVTPAERHEGKDVEILAHRKSVYAEAKQRQPARWSGEIRDWTPVDTVWLNPEKAEASAEEIVEEVA